MITTDRKIRIYDDTGSGDTFIVDKILSERDKIIVASVINEWYEGSIDVVINKINGNVLSDELHFYYAENFDN